MSSFNAAFPPWFDYDRRRYDPKADGSHWDKVHGAPAPADRPDTVDRCQARYDELRRTSTKIIVGGAVGGGRKPDVRRGW